MMQPPNAPASQRLRLRGDYSRAAPDYTVEQRWDDYDGAEHAIWRTLYERQIALARRYAPPEFIAGLETIGASAAAIPRFSEVNRRLGELTGWRIVAVPGLIPEEHFFAHLAARSFPVSVWMREPEELDYLVEPDLFHDFFGHVPLLTHPPFARFMQAYGEAGSKARAHGAVHLLARLYWYTVEFGLVRSGGRLKACGAGIISSQGETIYSIESEVPHRLAFDLERVMRTRYLVDAYQRIYFVLEGFGQLFHAGYDTDFAPIYERFAHEDGFEPGQLVEGDRIITRGTQASERPT